MMLHAMATGSQRMLSKQAFVMHAFICIGTQVALPVSLGAITRSAPPKRSERDALHFCTLHRNLMQNKEHKQVPAKASANLAVDAHQSQHHRLLLSAQQAAILVAIDLKTTPMRSCIGT